MGTFARSFKTNESKVPEQKKEEFMNRIEKLYQAGGMMKIEEVQLYGKCIQLIRKVKMEQAGMNFCYNYFEDDSWENAGFNREKCYVWSNKIGWRHFHKTVTAAYVLEELYTEGISATLVNGKLVTSWGYVGWINYLFGETFHIKNFDPWKLFEALHDFKEDYSSANRFDFGESRYAFIGECEIAAVLNDTQKALKVFEKREKGKLEALVIDAMKCEIDNLEKYKENNQLDKEKQLSVLLNMIRTYYELSENDVEPLHLKDENLKKIAGCLFISDAPAFLIKAISERYEKDFWELWKEVQHIVKRKFANLYGNEGYYIEPVSTIDFFRQSPDDMIPYWEEICDFTFSDKLWEWFENLKNRFYILFYMDFSIENPLKYIVDLIESAQKKYHHMYPFAEFFEESLENLGDKRYMTLWKLYEEIFDMTERKETREMLRRYAALTANKELRYKVFGF